jgi:hypothetical protein
VLLRRSAASRGRGFPALERLVGEVVGEALGGEEFVVGGGPGPAEVRVYVVVPLADPGHDLGEAGDEGGEAVGGPAVGGGALGDEGDERVGLLAVVPAGPAEQEGVVSVGAGAGVGDEALLGDVELAAVPPVGGPLEVGAGVLGRDRDVQPLARLRCA